jgi:hypothetical protein
VNQLRTLRRLALAALTLEFPNRFLVGSDTWVNARWDRYETLMTPARLWLGDLQTAVAKGIARGNAAALFGLPAPIKSRNKRP